MGKSRRRRKSFLSLSLYSSHKTSLGAKNQQVEWVFHELANNGWSRKSFWWVVGELRSWRRSLRTRRASYSSFSIVGSCKIMVKQNHVPVSGEETIILASADFGHGLQWCIVCILLGFKHNGTSPCHVWHMPWVWRIQTPKFPNALCFRAFKSSRATRDVLEV